MIAAAASPLRVVLYEGAGAAPLPEADRLSVLKALLQKGYRVGRSTEGGRLSPHGEEPLLVLGRFSQAAALPDTGEKVTFRSIEGLAPEEVLETVEAAGQAQEAPAPGGWKPWFPVIDYDRCTNCMQCLSFCLFDVYGVENGRISVRNQNKCKTDCPACSRVCPEVAILFPKYRSGPINGDNIDPEDLRREAMKVDISALLGGDIYQALRDRSAKAKSRFSKERDEDRALKERQRCLVELTKNLDIPPEVLASLPSLDQIQAKAEEAKAKGEAALAALGERPA